MWTITKWLAVASNHNVRCHQKLPGEFLSTTTATSSERLAARRLFSVVPIFFPNKQAAALVDWDSLVAVDGTGRGRAPREVL